MKIKIAEVVEWDDALPLEEQSMMAQAWYNENVQSKLTVYDDEKGVKPKRDKYGRPELWVVDTPTATFEVKWNFHKKESADWTKGKTEIKIKKK